MTYTVTIQDGAAEEVEMAVKNGAGSLGAVISDALAARKWIRDNAKAGRLYIKQGNKFVEVTLKA